MAPRELDQQSDWELLEAHRRGDRRAATVLFHRHYPRVVKTFSGVSTADADDLLQDTFLAAFSVTEDKVISGEFGAYVVGISRKKLASYFSKISRKKLMVEVSQDDPLVSDYVIAKRQDRVFLEALRTLDANYQHVILLRYTEATYPEIASLLDIPIGTVRSRLSRGKAELEKALAKLEKCAHRFDSTATTVMTWARDILDSLAGGSS
jgi:RNA polymerase sigma factor (sigma-70 family)